ncbi:MAG TPA: S8 family serine peptidase, partial [Vicinamibacterales bacterium]|nr:S8 family serine peptidase [Vicinamibacterales bacterium]
MLRRAPALACLALILSVRIPADAIGRATLKPVSLHNRLLLNRLAVIGEKWVEVMLAVERSQFQVVSARIERAGGHIRRKDRLVGYIRARIPIERMLEVVSDRAVDAYQVSSLSKGSWYRDAPAEANAEMFRNREVGPIISSSRTPSRLELPTLSVERAKDDGYTADRATGVSDWLETHPHFDGRGITIALLESAQLEFAHPTLQTARTLDGREISKIAGVIDVVDVEDRDDTRVALGPEFRATSTWCRVGARTYIVPRPGRYRFGLFTLPVGKGLAQHVGVLRDEVTGEIRVDTDDTGDFSQLIPVSDVNTRFEVRKLRVPYPRPYELAFVVANGKSPNVVHVYLARDRHQTMTASVAAGSRVVDGFSYGVAPSARILLVRNTSGDFQLHDFLEGFLEAAQRPEVDVICDSGGIFMVPDTSRDFVGLFMSRIMTVYDKPIVHAAGNTLLFLNDVSSLGAVISVGSSLSPATFSALLGGG